MGVNREVQLHMAVTIMPKHHAITKEEMKEDEICQFAAAFKPEHYGAITTSIMDKIFDEFKFSVLKKMRERGILQAGQ